MDTTSTTHPPRPLVLAGAAGLASVLTAGWWLLHPRSNQFSDADSAMLRAVLDPAQTAAAMLAIGLLGLLLAGSAVLVPSTRARLGVPAALLALSTLGLFGLSVIAWTGYLVALVLPVLLAVVVGQAVRHGGRPRWLALIGTSAVLAALASAGLLTGDAVSVVSHVAPTLVESLPAMSAQYLLLALAGTWALVAARGDVGTAVGSWTLRHRRTVTVLAALGPVPYAFVRLSWLTPWPALAPAELPGDVQLWGLLLAGGAWLGAVLTLGLIRPWGEVFPRWVPGLAGREVPVWCAAAPGGFVAAAVSAAALPMLSMLDADDGTWQIGYALLMPFWAWGPLLGLAVWAYVLHRRAGAGTPAATPRPRLSPDGRG